MTSAANPRSTQWIPSLAGYRALAALAVFGFHIASIQPPQGTLGQWIIPLGSAAVSLFFALSGFLIYRPFATWAFGIGEPVDTVGFVLRRAARILPLYWTVLTVHLFVLGRGGATSFGDYLTAYTLIQNFRGSLVFIPPFVAWSLSIELWFSTALPFIAAVLRRFGHLQNLRTKLFVQLAGFIWLAGLANVFRIWAVSQERGGGELLWVPAYLDWFAAGTILAILTTYWRIRTPPITVRRLARQPGLLAGLGLASYWVVTRIGIPGGFVPTTSFQTHAQFGLQALASFLLLSAAVLPNAQLGAAGRLLSSRLAGWVGSISYGVYLIHPVVIDELLDRWNPNRWVLTPLALATTILAAYGVHRLVEVPAARWVDERLGLRRSHKPSQDRPSSGGPSAGLATDEQPGTASVRSGPMSTILEQETTLRASVGSLPVLATMTSALALVVTLLARPGVYVADARYELFVNPTARLTRSLHLWDPSRDLGRTAEEFWPGLVLLSTLFSELGLPAWINERLIHAFLISLAGIGAMVLSRTLKYQNPLTTILAGALYAFGPFSALFLVPSPLYLSYTIAPWAVIGVIRASRGIGVLRWSGIVSLCIFLAGNADIPGLAYALVPALITWISLFVARPPTRRPLLIFTLLTIVTAGMTSAAMMVKTSSGAEALSHRLIETESADTVAGFSSMSESFRGMGFWLSYFRLGPTPLRTQGLLFLESPVLVIVTFIPLLVGLVGILRHRRSCDFLILAWILAAVVLMTGPHPIDNPTTYGRLILWLYEQSELAFGFRSTHKAGVGMALGTSLLGAAGISSLTRAWRRRFETSRLVPAVIIAALLLALFQPFWRTALYDPALTSNSVPDHWQETAEWFSDNPPEGRVLVLPGSTNNGYRWGSVGDDLLDPIIPNRVVASTLPLSTALGAELIQSLDELLTSPSYQPGTLAPLARRLGMTHVLLRNDLDWERQGLPRPRDLQSLRSDPDLVPVAEFGNPGLFSTSPLDPVRDPVERELPAIQIYAIRPDGIAQPSPVSSMWRLPANNAPRQILLSGDGDGVLQAASQGLLDGNEIIRLSATVTSTQVDDLTGDISRMVLTDTNRQQERRIEYYGFSEIPVLKDEAEISSSINHWLTGFADPGTMTTVDLDGASVSSSIDPWLLGAKSQPVAALDGDPNTAWRIPFLVSTSTQQWSLSLREPNRSILVKISLVNPSDQRQQPTVLLDSIPTAFTPTEEGLELRPTLPFSNITIVFDPTASALRPTGIEDVFLSEDSPVIVTTMPSDLTSLLEQFPTLKDELSAVPLTILMEGPNEDGVGLSRKFTLWRADTFSLSATMTSPGTTTRCNANLLKIDGQYIPVRYTPGANNEGRLTLCPSVIGIPLEAGTHTIELQPLDGDGVGILRLDSDQEQPSPVTRQVIDLSETMPVEPGDLLVWNAAFDARWRLPVSGDTESLTPVPLDSLNGWVIPEAITISKPEFTAERPLKVALAITFVGVLLSFGLIVSPQPSIRQAVRAGPIDKPERRVLRWVNYGALGLISYFVGGTLGLAGAVMGIAILLLAGSRRGVSLLLGLAATGVGLMALISASTLIGQSGALLDVDQAAPVASIVTGLLTITLMAASDESTRLRSSTRQTLEDQEPT